MNPWLDLRGAPLLVLPAPGMLGLGRLTAASADAGDQLVVLYPW